MKIKMTVKIIDGNREHEEFYDIDNNLNPNTYASDLINKFNATLRTGESPRELVDVIIVEQTTETKHDHDWQKQNLITIFNSKENSFYDVMKCSRCGITGKRFGLARTIIRDSKYKAKIYGTCEDTLSQLEKLRKRQPKS